MSDALAYRQPTQRPLPTRLTNQVVAIIAKNINEITIFLLRDADGKLSLPGGDMLIGECENDAIARLVKEQTHVTPDSQNPVGIFQRLECSIFAFEIISYRGTLPQEMTGEQLFFSIPEIRNLQKEINDVDFQIIGHYWHYYDPGVFIFDRLTPWFKPKKDPWKPKKLKRTTR